MVDYIILGLDALDPRWVKYFYAKGRMPQFGNLLSEGSATMGSIDSLIVPSHQEPYTTVAWPSIYTGGDHNHHGVTVTPFKVRTFNFAETLNDTIFDDVSEAKRMASFRMPMTWPARDVNGWMVSGFPAGGRDGTTATESEVYGLDLDQIPDDFHQIEEEQMSKRDDAEVKKSLTHLVNKEDRSMEICDSLVDQDDIDVLFYGTQLPDKVAHYFYGDKEKKAPDKDLENVPKEDLVFPESNYARAAYAKVDEIIGHMIETYDPEMLWAVGDHGIKKHGELEGMGHAFETAIIEYRKEGTPAVSSVDTIMDLREFWTNRMNISRTIDKYEGEEQATNEVSEEEMEEVEDRLSDLGYM